MNKKQETIYSYNKHAEKMAERFNGLLGYPEEIKKVFVAIAKENPRVLEIGCGSGRDAKEILKYTKDYLGIDYSSELIKHAKSFTPEANFLVADFENFIFPKKIDAIFSFASLLHSDKENIRKFFNKAYESLNDGGVVLLSLKYDNEYREERKINEFGIRTFYYYSPVLIKEIAGERFRCLFEEMEKFNGQKWFCLIFQK